MTAPRLAVVVVLLVVVSTTAVGATAAPGAEQPATAGLQADGGTPSMGANISMFMQANAAQTDGTVENGMWVAAYARANATEDRRALVERRVGSIDATLAELQAERRALLEAYRSGSIDRVTFQARLSTLVGQLAALGEGIEETSERGEAVGVNTTRLDQLRTQARSLGGGEVSRIARNLTDDHRPPGRAGVFGAGQRGPPEGANPTDGGGPPNDPGGGPPSDRGQSEDESTPTET